MNEFINEVTLELYLELSLEIQQKETSDEKEGS